MKSPAQQRKQKTFGAIYRCDLMKHRMNRQKNFAVQELLSAWREAAHLMANAQWRRFWSGQGFSDFADPLAEHRVESAAVHTGLVRQLALRGGRDLAAEASVLAASGSEISPRGLAALAPGLIDPMAPIKARLGVSRYQMVRKQVVGMLGGFLANRTNEFRALVHAASFPEATKHELQAVNSWKAWFDLKRPVTRRVTTDDAIIEVTVSMESRRLARKLMAHVLGKHRKPSMRRIGMVIDQRAVTVADARKPGAFPIWLRLQTLGRRGRNFATIDVPLVANAYFQKRQGTRKLTVQVSQDRETGALRFGLMTDVAEAMAASRAAYAPKVEAMALDWGLSTLFATETGDLLGRGWLEQLKVYDRKITRLAAYLQKHGMKPRGSKRYRALVNRVRGFIESEINRVLNRLVAVKAPMELLLERIAFRGQGLSRRLNRILANCGRSVLADKLKSLEQQFGITATEINPAYTSQTCSSCGYVDPKNRPHQALFSCRWCGRTLHADVNASRNIGRRRSSPIGSQWSSKAATLRTLVSGFLERQSAPRTNAPCRRSGSMARPADPRLANPYFRDWAAEVMFKNAVATNS